MPTARFLARAVTCSVAFACLGVAPPAFAATTFYVAPSGSGNACTQADPCSSLTPVTHSGDTVIFIGNQGTYGSPTFRTAVDLHVPAGVTYEGAPGQPMPVWYSDSSDHIAVTMDDITSRLSDFRIEFGGSNGLALNGLGTADRVIAHATGSNDWGCSVPTNFSPTLTLTNSICEGSEALVSSVSGIWNLTLRNDLLYSPGDALTVIDTAQMYTVNVSNTILHSTGGKDIRADGPGAVNITADHSNYATVTNTSAGNVTSAGSGTNQTAAPQFVNAGADDFRQAASSPTIGAGTDDPANGLVDLSGLPRKIGVHTDIGPYEAVLAPSLSVLAAAGISTGGATVNSSINPNAAATTYRVDYGPSPTYGASSAGQLQGDTSAHAIAVALSGLKPATTYHYRFVATNSAGTTTGADQTFTTLAPPVASPAVSGLKQSARKWREGKSQPQISRKRRPGIGTTFRFTLNDAAKVRFAFRRVVRGRRLGHRCVAPRRGNAHKRACRKTIGAGALTFAGHAGSNAVRFQGRLSRKRKLRLGSYKLVVTATNAAGHSAARSISFKIVH